MSLVLRTIHSFPQKAHAFRGPRFLKRQNMLGLEAIGNNGYNSSIIIKTFESNVDEYNEFILNEIDKFKSEYSELNVEKDINLINKFCKMLLEKGEKIWL